MRALLEESKSMRFMLRQRNTYTAVSGSEFKRPQIGHG